MARFSFKKQARRSGLGSIGEPVPGTLIKLGGKPVGRISPPSWHDDDRRWSVSFSVRGGGKNPNCEWRWISLKAKFEEEAEARDFVQQHTDRIQAKYDLFVVE